MNMKTNHEYVEFTNTVTVELKPQAGGHYFKKFTVFVIANIKLMAVRDGQEEMKTGTKGMTFVLIKDIMMLTIVFVSLS